MMLCSKFLRSWSVAMRLVGAVLVAVLLVFVMANPALAKTKKPGISSLKVSPKQVVTTNGTVNVSAKVSGASTCTLSSTSFVAGLPSTTMCNSGEFDESVVLQQNEGAAPLPYVFSLSATGLGGTKAKTFKVKVAPGAGQPWPTGFTGTYLGSDDSGGDIDGTFSFSGTINPDVYALNPLVVSNGQPSPEIGQPILPDWNAHRGPLTTARASVEEG